MKYTEKYGFIGLSLAFRFVGILLRNVVLPMFEWINRGLKDGIRIALLIASLLQPTALLAQSVKVRYREGVGHGFLVLRTSDGKPVADGDSTQLAQGGNVTSRVLAAM